MIMSEIPLFDPLTRESLWKKRSLKIRQEGNEWVESSRPSDFSSAVKTYVGNSIRIETGVVLLFFILFGFLVVAGRAVYLQIFHGGTYRELAENNRERIIPIPSERGLIYDRNLVRLTMNVPNFSLALIPQDLPRDKEGRSEIVKQLHTITNIPEEDIRKKIEEFFAYSYESVVIQENLDYETALRLQIAAAELPGIFIQRGSKRLYSEEGEESSLSHVLGYIGKINPAELDALHTDGYLPSDWLGRNGIEKTYERVMRGTYGKKTIEVNAFGRERSVLSEIPPEPGSHIVLHIDSEIQHTLESLLKKTLEKFEKRRAVAVALDPRTGAVRALVSLPAFYNNDFSGGITVNTYEAYINDPDRPLFDRAIGGMYPSGSTLKPAIAAAALAEGTINADTSILSTGGIQVGPWFFPDWRAGGHGPTNVRSAIANSVNTFFYYIGGGYGNFVGLGIEKLSLYLQRFGFGSLLGIDLPGEEPGFLPSKEWKLAIKEEQWYIGDTYNVSIGQGDILVTPLQIASMTAVIANGGTLYRPQVVEKIIDGETQEEEIQSPQKIHTEVVNPDSIQIIREGMRACVTSGSCQSLSSLPIAVAGKTGTAQWSAQKPNHAWFTSFAPYDAPEIVLTILVEEGEEGSRVAAPVAKAFYSWWARYRLVDNVY